PVWFNAWQYEKEKHFALIPLLNTIADTVEKFDASREDYKQDCKKLSGTFNEIGLAFLRSSSDIVSLILPGYVGGVLKAIIDAGATGLNKSYDKIVKDVNDSLYFKGLDQIKADMVKMIDKYPPFRIVVFIDDLDRCSPSKMLEVFESTKVFLDIDGFIFVLGISYNIIVERIEKTENLDDGNEYLKKLIELPIFLPSWSNGKLDELIQLQFEKIREKQKSQKYGENELKKHGQNKLEMRLSELKVLIENDQD